MSAPVAATKEVKLLPLTSVAYTPDAAEGAGAIAGYASVFHGVDAYGDTIVPGAYQQTIPTFLRDGSILWGHRDDKFPVAYPTAVYEDDRGLWLEAAFHSDGEAQRARAIVAERLAAGKRMGLSIGYIPKAAEFDADGTRRLTDIELIETSIVLSPADDNARVALVKEHPAAAVKALEAPAPPMPPAEDDAPPQDAEDTDDAETPLEQAAYGTVSTLGLSWEAHAATVIDQCRGAEAHLVGLVTRARLQADLRDRQGGRRARKEGRRLSQETRQLLEQTLAAEDGLAATFAVLRQLLEDTAPPPKGYRPQRALMAECLLAAGLPPISAEEESRE